MTFKSATLAGLLSAALFATAMPAHALTIDSFDCGDNAVKDLIHGGPLTSTVDNLACVIGGGDRYLEVYDVTGTQIGPPDRSVSATIGGGVLDMQQSSNVNSALLVNWSDFGIVDLTEGGINNGFDILVEFVDQWLKLEMFVVDSADNLASHSVIVNTPGGHGYLPFAAFAGVDFTLVKALTLDITGPTSFDPTLNYVNASPVPEPATFMLLGLGLLGIGAKRALRKA